MNYYDTIDTIKNVFLEDDEVATITHGNITDVDLEATTIYPLVHMTPTGVLLKERTKVYSFNIVVMSVLDFSKADKREVLDPFYGIDNSQDVLAQMLYVVERAIYKMHRKNTLKEKNALLNSLPSPTPFIGDYNNGAAGWTFTINIETPSASVDNGIC